MLYSTQGTVLCGCCCWRVQDPSDLVVNPDLNASDSQLADTVCILIQC